MNPVPTWLGLLGVHQDLIWFLVLMGWSFVLILWWRSPGRAEAWRWLPWAAAAGILTALLQFLVFNPPFGFFYERLVPGTNDTYMPALVDPDFFADTALAAVFAGIAAAWWWRAANEMGARALRVPVVVLCIGIVCLDANEPLLAGTILALLPFMALMRVWPRTARHAWARGAVILAALLPAVSTAGPLAYMADKLQRAGPTGWFGALFGAVHLLCVGAILAGLLGEAARCLDRDRRRALWRDARPFLIGGTLWLIIGTFFALRSGYDEAWEVKTNRLRTAASRASIFNPDLLTPLAGRPLNLDLNQVFRRPDGTAVAVAGNLTAETVLPLERELAQIVRSTPFVKRARFVLLREGWLVAVADNLPVGPPGTVQLLRRATPEDAANWEAARDVIEELPVPEERQPYYCWAAVVGPDGRMLGWLDYMRSEFYSSMERKWRTGPLLVTALGAILAAAFFVQRRSSRERSEALRAAAVAAEAGRIKTAFLANVSHELRTPLQSILGYSELLQRDLVGVPPRAHLAALRQQGELMVRLVNDLIDLSAVETGSFPLTVRPFAPAEVTSQTVESLRPRAAAKGLALRVELDPALPARVATDDGRFRQVLINLTGNAVKFTDRGTVTVTLHVATGPDDRGRLVLAVRDTGPGIPPAQQARLFTPFSRLTQTADREGSGLGLALSAGLCRALGGDLRVESDGVSGSCFTATFGIAATDGPSPAPAVIPPTPGFSPRVLVIDDNRLVRDLFVAALTERGARCSASAHGAGGLALAARENPGAIVLDLALSDGDGADFALRLRQLAPAARIIGVSAHAGVGERARALAAGMHAFLAKPVPLDELWAAVTGFAPASAPAAPVAFFNPPAALQSRLLDEFFRDLPPQRVRLAGAVAAGNWPVVRSDAHYLRNSALVVQSAELLEAATRLEAAAAASPAEASRWWRQCETALDGLRRPREIPLK